MKQLSLNALLTIILALKPYVFKRSNTSIGTRVQPLGGPIAEGVCEETALLAKVIGWGQLFTVDTCLEFSDIL